MKKVHPFKIPKPVHERLVVQVDKSVGFYDKLHQHEEIQISYVLSGNGKLIVADSIHSFSSGNIFVIGPNCPHVFLSATGTETSHMISVFFTRKSFGQHFFDLPEMEQLQQFFKRSDAGFKIVSEITIIAKLLQEITRVDKLSRFILFLKLLKTLSTTQYQVLTAFIYPKRISVNEGNRMQTVFNFVMNNFHQEISLKTVAEMAFMTPSAFCRFFKLRTNKTFFQFLIDLRIEHACQLLIRDSTLSIAEISSLSGFTSISNFNRKFKEKKKLTPSGYFRKMSHRIA